MQKKTINLINAIEDNIDENNNINYQYIVEELEELKKAIIIVEPEPFCRWNFSGTVGEFNKYLEVMQEYN